MYVVEWVNWYDAEEAETLGRYLQDYVYNKHNDLVGFKWTNNLDQALRFTSKEVAEAESTYWGKADTIITELPSEIPPQHRAMSCGVLRP